MQSEVYADSVSEVLVTESIIRIDLVSLSLEKSDRDGAPEAVVRQRVIMPVEGFLKSAELIARVTADLKKHRAPATDSARKPNNSSLMTSKASENSQIAERKESANADGPIIHSVSPNFSGT